MNLARLSKINHKNSLQKRSYAQEPSKFPHRFTWLELQTSDLYESKHFLSSVFGWKAVDYSVGFYKRFTLDNAESDEVAGIYQTRDEDKAHMFPNVQLMMNTENILDTIDIVEQCGGTVIVSPVEVKGRGTTAIIRDIEGATFALWEPKLQKGFKDIPFQHGLPSYFELTMHDIEKTAEFYKTIFGFDMENIGRGYFKFTYSGTEVNIGARRLMNDWVMDPPEWRAYIEVSDIEKSLVAVKEAGGEIVESPEKINNRRRALIKDPTNSLKFGLVQTFRPKN